MPHHVNRRLAGQLAMIAVGMVMLSFAAVPLYRLFCQVTGFGGTPMIATTASENVSPRAITVTFVANTDPNLPWKFTPDQASATVHVGENRLISYLAENQSGADVSGMATYNVTPHAAGRYFNKVQCFCFERQTLNANQKVHMPVSFFIDPAILDDPELRDLTNITLSYTFFNVESANTL